MRSGDEIVRVAHPIVPGDNSHRCNQPSLALIRHSCFAITMALKSDHIREVLLAIAVSLFAAMAFYFSTKATLHDLDYTNQIASALLHGQLGLQEKPPDWLNEMIPWEGRYYSAFPLGAVLSMLPIALLRNTGLIQSFPGRVLAALIAGLCVYFFFQLAKAFKGNWNNSSPIRPLAVPARRSLGEGGSPFRPVLLAVLPIL